MQEKLNPDFLVELFAALFKPNNKDLVQIVVKELDFQYLPDENYKKVFRQVTDSFDTLKRVPTIPVLSQEFDKDLKVLNLLAKFSKIDNIDKVGLITQLEKFIKEREFLIRYDEFGDLWNSGQKQKVYELMLSTANKINDYSLTKNSFTKVLDSFKDRHQSRLANSQTSQKRVKKVPFFIDPLDDIVKGGMDRGDTFLIIAGSGKFKSTAKRWVGYNAALSGLNVVHFMAEDTEDATTNLYDAALLGESLYSVQGAEYESEKVKQLMKKIREAQFHKGEVYLKTFERFDDANLGECRSLLFDLVRDIGEIHLIIFDYLELFDPSDGVKYGGSDTRQKRESIANKMKNIAMEFNSAVLTSTQAMDIAQNLIDDPNFVIRRNHISEFKGLVKPFSGVISLNQTQDEYDSQIMRIHCDKFRNYKLQKDPVKIAQSTSVGRFYSKKKTLALNLYNPEG